MSIRGKTLDVTPSPSLYLVVTREEAQLLLDLVQQHANANEFDPNLAAQTKAFDSWLLAGRIADLLQGQETDV